VHHVVNDVSCQSFDVKMAATLASETSSVLQTQLNVNFFTTTFCLPVESTATSVDALVATRTHQQTDSQPLKPASRPAGRPPCHGELIDFVITSKVVVGR